MIRNFSKLLGFTDTSASSRGKKRVNDENDDVKVFDSEKEKIFRGSKKKRSNQDILQNVDEDQVTELCNDRSSSGSLTPSIDYTHHATVLSEQQIKNEQRDIHVDKININESVCDQDGGDSYDTTQPSAYGWFIDF